MSVDPHFIRSIQAVNVSLGRMTIFAGGVPIVLPGRADLLAYVVDRNPAKQGKFLPGSRIPIVSPDHLIADQPAWIVILPWNLRDEVIGQMAEARQWGARFVTAIPDLAVHA